MERKINYVMLRFYGGGGLANSEWVTCNEEDLFDNIARFEKECASSNLGEYCAVLDEEELNNIIKER